MIRLSFRGVAQLASAPALGAGGRRFESGRPDIVFYSDFLNLLIAFLISLSLKILFRIKTNLFRGTFSRSHEFADCVENNFELGIIFFL